MKTFVHLKLSLILQILKTKISFTKCCYILLLFIGVLIIPANVFAQTKTSTGGNWNTAGTWSPSGVPGAGDSVVITSGSVTIDVNATVGALTVKGDLHFSTTANRTLTVSTASGRSGDVSILSPNGILYIGEAAGQILYVAGNFTCANGINWGVEANNPKAVFNGTGSKTLNNACGQGNFEVNSSTLILTVTAQPANISGNITVTAGTLDMSTFDMTFNSATFGETLSVANGATLKIGGTRPLPPSFPNYSFGATSTVEYYGAAQTITNKLYGNLTLSGSGIKTMPGTSMTLAGNFTTSGTVTATAVNALLVGGNFTVGSGTTFSGATFSHTVAGNFSNSGTFTANTSTFTFNGSGAGTTLGGSATTFYKLTMNRANGLTLTATITVSNLLTFTTGNITTGANSLYLNSTGTFSRSSGHVIGNFKKNVVTGATSKTFEIGDATNYTPVTVAFASVTTAGDLTASTVAGDHANIGSSTINPVKTANRTWTLTNSGIGFTTYGATFTFVAGDLDGSAATANFIVGRYSAGWTYPTVGTKTATSTQATGLTSLSDFQVGELGPVTWTGAVSNLWSNAGNWSGHGGAALTGGEDLIFPTGAANISTSNDMTAGTSFNSITISGSGYTLAGNSIALGAGNLTDATTSGSSTISLAISMAATRTVSITNAAETLTISGVMSGAGGLTKTGAGTLTLSGANTFTGATSINAGVLNARHATALGTTAGGVTVASGARLELQGTIAVGAEALSISGTGGGSGALLSVSGTNSFAGAITLAAASTIGSTTGTLTSSGGMTNGGFLLTVAGAGNTTASTVAISGAGGLTKTGAGTLTLSAANTYTGATTINGGVISVAADNNLGAVPGSPTVGKLVFNAGTLATTATFTLSADRGIAFTGNATFDVAAATTLTYGGIATGSGAVTKTSAGTLALTSGIGNTYTGGTTVNAGTISLTAANSGTSSVGTGTLTINSSGTVTANSNNVFGYGADANVPPIVINGGTLNPNQYTHVKSIDMTAGTISAESPTGGDGLYFDYASSTVTTHASATSATIAAMMTSVTGISFSVEDGAATTDLLVSGAIVGLSATSGLTKTGAGTMAITSQVISSANWPLAINGGKFSVAGTVYNLLGTSYPNITIAAGATLSADNTSQNAININTLTLNGGTLANGTAPDATYGTWILRGAVTVSGGTSTSTISANHVNPSASPTVFTVSSGASNGIDLDVTGILSADEGSYPITKAGAGVMRLTGANTYTGATTINGGVISVAADNNLGAAPGSPTAGQLTFGGGTLATTATFTLSANRGIAFTGAATLDVASATTLTYAGIATGAGGLTKTSAGILSLGGATFTMGDFTLTAGTVTAPSATGFTVRGNWIHNSTFTPGTGTVTFNGASAQIVSGSQVLNLFNLVTNNSSGITLNTDLSISGAHTFSAGMITTSATPNYLIYAAGSSYSGDADTRHVNGWVKKSGSTNFTFPVGNATYERVAAISNLSASSEINCKYNTLTGNTINLFSPLAMVKANEYWQFDKVSGGTAQVTLNWDHSKVAMDNVLIIDILSSQYTTGNWTSTGGTASGNITTTGTITSNALSSFGPLTLGYTSFPVPLKLLSFTAIRASGTSFLKWITENEQNVDRFDVQRSYNGSLFTTIGSVAARNSGSREVYDFEDHSALNGIAYYRIKSVDIDGKLSYSRIAVVTEYDLQSSTFVVLNPARNFITILNKSGEEGPFDYHLYNAAGQLLLKGNTNMGINGGAALPLPPHTAAGIYMLEISNDKVQFHQKLLIEK